MCGSTWRRRGRCWRGAYLGRSRMCVKKSSCSCDNRSLDVTFLCEYGRIFEIRQDFVRGDRDWELSRAREKQRSGSTRRAMYDMIDNRESILLKRCPTRNFISKDHCPGKHQNEASAPEAVSVGWCTGGTRPHVCRDGSNVRASVSPLRLLSPPLLSCGCRSLRY